MQYFFHTVHRWVGILIIGGLALGTVSVAHGQTPVPFDPRYDITGNGRVNGPDAESLRDTWASLRSNDQCSQDGLASRDLNGDGCIDIADVQLVAAHIGEAVPGAPRPNAALAGEEIVHTVTSTLSDDDVTRGDGVCSTAASSPSAGKCTLRAAIQEANAHPGPDRIVFNIRNTDGSCPSGAITIKPSKDAIEYFMIEDDYTTIDGYTQCGAQPNTAAVAGNAVIKIQIDGQYVAAGGKTFDARLGVDGITIRSAHNLIRGLALFRWDHQILITGDQANYNSIQGNFLGTSADNTYFLSAGPTHHREGLRIWYHAAYNVIGCGSFDSSNTFQPCTSSSDAYGARNLVAGNGNDGIHFEGNPSTGSPDSNRIVGNYIGLKQDGVTPLGNASDAVDFEAGAINNWLGGESVLERNVISGNGSEGIEISHSTRTQGNRVVGNWFGLDASGTKIISFKFDNIQYTGNVGNAVSFEDTVNHNFAYKNRTAANHSGFRFYILATYNEVTDNVVGLLADDTTAAGSRDDGVYVMGGSQHNLIARNIIAHSGAKGVAVDPLSDVDHNWIGETYYNTISQNSIYDSKEAGIVLSQKAVGGLTIYGNQSLAKPRILAASSALVTGTACANCTIELFISDKTTIGGTEASGEGKTFVVSDTTNWSGQFNIMINLPVGTILTATATDSSGNTSEFARNVAIGTAIVATLTPAPTFTPTLPPTSTPTSTPLVTDTPTATPAQPTSVRVDETPGATATTTAPSELPYHIWLPVIIK